MESLVIIIIIIIIIIFGRKFQLMTFTPDDNPLSSDQDTNRILV